MYNTNGAEILFDSQEFEAKGTKKMSSNPTDWYDIIDDLRPDWNRRILAAAQRQPGSRRASTSSSVSGATFALGRRLAVGRSSGSNSRRSNSSAAAADYNGYLAAVRNMGTDLEELMMMEAMRQSLQDEQDRINRESAAAAAAAMAASSAQSASTTASPSTSTAGATSSSTTVGSDRQLSSSSSTATSSTAQGVAAMLGDDEYDQDSLVSDDEESDEDTPAQLHNQAIRYRNITGSRSGQMAADLSPKHRVGETANPTETL